MKQKFLTIIGFLVVGYAAYSQNLDPKFSWGEYEGYYKYELDSVIGHYQDHFYTVTTEEGNSISKTDVVVRKISLNDYSVQEEVEFTDFEYRGYDVEYKSARVDKSGNLNMYGVSYDKKRDRKSFVYAQMLPDGKIVKPKKLMELPEMGKTGGNLRSAVSPDSTLITVFSPVPSDSEYPKIQIGMFNQDHERLWEKDFTLKNAPERYFVEKLSVSNAGEVVFFTKEYLRRGTDAREHNQHVFQLWKATQDGVVKSQTIEGHPNIVSAKIWTDVMPNDYVVSGFYGGKYEKESEGFFYSLVDKSTLEIEGFTTQAYGDEVRKRIMRSRLYDRGHGAYGMKFNELLRRPNGGFTLIAQMEHESVMNNGASEPDDHIYQYNFILIAQMRPDFTLDYFEIIDKKNLSTNDDAAHSSYLLLKDDGKLAFVYNDDPENAGKLIAGEKTDGMGRVKKSSVVKVTLNNDGTLNYEALYENSEHKAYLAPNKSYRLGDNHYLIYAIRKGKVRFGQLYLAD